MALFSLVSPLLQELDRQGVAAVQAAWDGQVSEAIRSLEGRYQELRNRNRRLIDYGSLPVQMAYAFKYVGAHADFLHQVFGRAGAALGGALFARGVWRVTSLGGGPGSDLLALIKFVREMPANARPERIVYRVLDKQPNWHEALRIVADSHRALVDSAELVMSEFDYDDFFRSYLFRFDRNPKQHSNAAFRVLRKL